MSMQELRAKAREHWKTYLPTKWAELKAAGTEELALTEAARQAQTQIRALMDAGARLDEAEEIVLREVIYLPPEVSGLDEETEAELREKEAEYRRIYGDNPETEA